MPALDDLWPRQSETDEYATTTSQGIEGGHGHSAQCWRASGKLHNTSAEFDPCRLRGKIGKWGDGIGSVCFCGPNRVVPKPLRFENEIDGNFDLTTGIANT